MGRVSWLRWLSRVFMYVCILFFSFAMWLVHGKDAMVLVVSIKDELKAMMAW